MNSPSPLFFNSNVSQFKINGLGGLNRHFLFFAGTERCEGADHASSEPRTATDDFREVQQVSGHVHLQSNHTTPTQTETAQREGRVASKTHCVSTNKKLRPNM